MGDISVRVEGHAGRITLQRPSALNALTYDMILAIGKALDSWRDDAAVKIVVVDAEGEKAFSAGGDIAELYATGRDGNYEYGRKFWSDESCRASPWEAGSAWPATVRTVSWEKAARSPCPNAA